MKHENPAGKIFFHVFFSKQCAAISVLLGGGSVETTFGFVNVCRFLHLLYLSCFCSVLLKFEPFYRFFPYRVIDWVIDRGCQASPPAWFRPDFVVVYVLSPIENDLDFAASVRGGIVSVFYQFILWMLYQLNLLRYFPPSFPDRKVPVENWKEFKHWISKHRRIPSRARIDVGFDGRISNHRKSERFLGESSGHCSLVRSIFLGRFLGFFDN